MFRKIKIDAVITAVLLSASLPTFAWDEVGHKITAYIAWQRMTPDVRERVIKTLLAAPEDAQLSTFYAGYGSRSQEARQREFFMLVATWPDIIRDKNFPVRQKNYAHSDWHYSDTFWQWKDNKVQLVTDAESSGKAVDKLAEFDKLIRSGASDPEKAVAIAWLEHLIGDIHQPLHASARVTSSNTKGDQGGNLFLLTPKGTPKDKQENLHWFWDSIVIRYQPNSKDVCDADYIDPIADQIIKLYPYDKLKGELADEKFDVWKDESFKIASTEVYRGVNWFEAPSDKYKKKAFEIAQRRMALAGYRMAELFNDAFAATKPTEAAAPAKQ
jgi:hypothetical protein